LPRTVVVDAGPLAAAINRDDPDHTWAREAFARTQGQFITCEAAITEALHILENHPLAIAALQRLVARMKIIPLAHSDCDRLLAEMLRYAPQMDFADACAVMLARSYPRAFVLTTDFSDFSTYRVPFASPLGVFHD